MSHTHHTPLRIRPPQTAAATFRAVLPERGPGTALESPSPPQSPPAFSCPREGSVDFLFENSGSILTP